jgi:transglutaminase-like putative cysteine protease
MPSAKSVARSQNFEVECSLVYSVPAATDFVFLVHALDAMDQTVLHEDFTVSEGARVHLYADEHMGHRFARVRAKPGELSLNYTARVRRKLAPVDEQAQELPIARLPDAILHNLMPTRYCESDLLGHAAAKLFGDREPGFSRVQAIADWIYDNVDYRIGSTQSTTSAADVFLSRAGVCRDFAHLGVSFCRALNIPARLVAGYAIFDQPPTDFHAVFEAYLGKRWVMFDPTRMSPHEHFVRIASGRDAKDVAFATLFGPVTMLSMSPQIRLVD